MVIRILILAAVAATSGGDAERPQIPHPLTAEFLANIEEIPFGKLGAGGSPEYQAIVLQGLGIVPELVELLDDPTPTDRRVPLFGGFYAVGDVAMSAMSDIIVGLPWLRLIPEADDARIDAIGFAVYWEYVRESASNRRELKHQVLEWLAEHEACLEWQPMPELPSGGVYNVPESHDDR